MAPAASLIEPGRRPWLKALAIGAALLLVPLIWWTVLALAGTRVPVPVPSGLSTVLIVVAALVIAPLLETAVLALLHWLTIMRIGLPRAAFVGVAVAAAVAAHLPLTLVRTPVTATIFVVFAWQYAAWSAARGWRIAFLGTALAHAAYNTGSLALSPLWAFLLRPA
ncbi:MAG: hypothetical protein Q8O26_17625 [Phreatobacter sp.]|uniref:hypothetical protein n=1 Tax=Phreatobacter sp. TaxID=1966341 RepID=UPI00273698F3|nr:hypothetical protein [Phreatobacter sp.]MDP2803693.1 hypothetical protein [Phreatobacter sp.]